VGSDYRTTVANIFAAGDVIGPPSLASASQNQGRCAVDFALGRTPSQPAELIPMGIYAIPEMSQIGLTEEQARQKHGGAVVGRAPFSEVARGQIAAIQDGLLKLVAAPDGRKLLGVQVVGEGAAELVSIGQTALLVGADVDLFADNTYNFPTMAEAYRVAALEIVRARGR
jgi:NAD(P) transhydrogenase